MWTKAFVDVRLYQVKQIYSLCACVCATMHVWWGHQLIRETDGVGPGADNPIRCLKRCDRLRSRKYDLIKGTLWPCAERPVPGGWQVCAHTQKYTDIYNKPVCLDTDTSTHRAQTEKLLLYWKHWCGAETLTRTDRSFAMSHSGKEWKGKLKALILTQKMLIFIIIVSFFAKWISQFWIVTSWCIVLPSWWDCDPGREACGWKHGRWPQ